MPSKPERPEGNDAHEKNAPTASDKLVHQALTLYQCPDGSIVNHPSECKEGLQKSPLQFSNIFENLKS